MDRDALKVDAVLTRKRYGMTAENQCQPLLD